MQLNLSGDVVTKLTAYKALVERESGTKVTWSYVINHLFRCYVENKELRTKIASKESKIEAMHDKTEHFLELALSRPMQQPMQFGGTQQNAFIGTPPPPPQITAAKIPSLPKSIDIRPSRDIKDDFTKEIKQVFTGGSEVLLKPSEIMKLCQPPHEAAVIVEIETDHELQEHDKDFYKVKTE
jgi:hypothetical protein